MSDTTRLVSVVAGWNSARAGHPRGRMPKRVLEGGLSCIAGGESISRCCREAGLVRDTALRRLLESPEVPDQYARARARDLGADAIALQVLDTVAMDLSAKIALGQARAAIDRKWAAARRSPRFWGDAASQRVAAEAVAAERAKGGFSIHIDLGQSEAKDESHE